MKNILQGLNKWEVWVALVALVSIAVHFALTNTAYSDIPLLAMLVVGGMALSVIAMGFAAGGYITPVAGALLQEVIDILAIANALRMTWQRRVEAGVSSLSSK